MSRIATIVLIALIGLGGSTALTPASAQSTLIVPREGVGDIKLGMSPADVFPDFGGS